MKAERQSNAKSAFERFAEMDTLLREVLERPLEQRMSFLTGSCRDDAVLRDGVLRLLRAGEDPDPVLDGSGALLGPNHAQSALPWQAGAAHDHPRARTPRCRPWQRPGDLP